MSNIAICPSIPEATKVRSNEYENLPSSFERSSNAPHRINKPFEKSLKRSRQSQRYESLDDFIDFAEHPDFSGVFGVLSRAFTHEQCDPSHPEFSCPRPPLGQFTPSQLKEPTKRVELLSILTPHVLHFDGPDKHLVPIQQRYVNDWIVTSRYPGLWNVILHELNLGLVTLDTHYSFSSQPEAFCVLQAPLDLSSTFGHKSLSKSYFFRKRGETYEITSPPLPIAKQLCPQKPVNMRILFGYKFYFFLTMMALTCTGSHAAIPVEQNSTSRDPIYKWFVILSIFWKMCIYISKTRICKNVLKRISKIAEHSVPYDPEDPIGAACNEAAKYFTRFDKPFSQCHGEAQSVHIDDIHLTNEDDVHSDVSYRDEDFEKSPQEDEESLEESIVVKRMTYYKCVRDSLEWSPIKMYSLDEFLPFKAIFFTYIYYTTTLPKIHNKKYLLLRLILLSLIVLAAHLAVFLIGSILTSACVTFNNIKSSLKQRKGERKADDQTVGTTAIHSMSAASSISDESFVIKTIQNMISPPAPPAVSPPSSATQSDAIFDVLFSDNMSREVLLFITALLATPRPSACGLACTATNLSLAFYRLTQAIARSYKTEAIKCLNTLTQVTEGLFTSESETDGAEEGGWLNDIANNLESLSLFSDSKVAKVLENFLAFVCTLPILVSELIDAETYMKKWKQMVKIIGKSGISISSVLKSCLDMQSKVLISQSAPGGSSILKDLLFGEKSSVEFVECQTIMRRLHLGELKFRVTELDSFGARLKRLEARTRTESVLPSGGHLEATRLSSVTMIIEEFSRFRKNSLGTRPTPFTISLDGPPSSGKTAFISKLIDVMHKWQGIDEFASTITLDTSSEFDNLSTNSTTCIILDDAGNELPNLRSQTLGSRLLNLIQPGYREIPKAHLEDKGKHFYQHYFLILTDNHPRRGIEEELFDPLAGFRRLGLCAKVRVVKEYANSSGGLDKSKAHNLSPFGEHLEFRPYLWKRTNPNSQPEISFMTEDFISHLKFYDLVKKSQTDHFKSELSRMEKELSTRDLKLCPHCLTLPRAYCACGQDFMTVASENTSIKVCDASESQYVGESLMSDISDQFGLINDGLPDRFSLVMMFLVSTIRFVITTDHPMREPLTQVMTRPICEGFITGGITYALLKMCGANAPEFLFLFSYIAVSLVLLYAVRILKRAWVSYAWDSNTIALRRYVTATGAFGSQNAKIIGIVGALLASKFMWNAFVSAVVPEHCKGESVPAQEEEKEEPATSTEVLAVKEATKLHWLLPFRKPAVGTHESKTISLNDMLSKVENNTFPGYVINSEDRASPVTPTFITSELCVVPTHVLLKVKNEKDFIMKMRHPGGNSATFTVHTSNCYPIPDKDLAFIYLPNRPLGQLRLLSKFLCKVPPDGKVMGGHVHYNEGLPIKEVYEGITTNTSYLVGNETITHEKVYRFNRSAYPTHNGECGTVYFSRNAPRCIYAMHCAGNKDTCSVAVPLGMADFLEAKSYFEENCFMKSTVEDGPRPPTVLGKPLEITEDISDGNPVNYLPDDGRIVEYEGGIPCPFRPQSSMTINPYVEQARHFLGLKLDKVSPRFQYKKSNRKVLLDATAEADVGDLDLLNAAGKMFLEETSGAAGEFMECYKDIDFDWSEPLFLHNVLNGIDGTPVTGLKGSTSAGHPVGGKKSDWFTLNDDIKHPVPELIAEFSRCLDRIRDSTTTGNVINSCLKNEMVKPEKRDHARLFYNSPIGDHMVVCHYFMVAIQVVSHLSSRFETAIGLNREGEDWLAFCEPYLQDEFRNNCFDTDFKSYDSNQCPALRNVANSVFMQICKELGYSADVLEECEKTLSLYQTPTVNMGGALVPLKNQLVSGYLLTAHINGISSSLLSRADFLRFTEDKSAAACLKSYSKHCGKDMSELYPEAAKDKWSFREHRINGTLGDDLVGSCSSMLRFSGWSINHFVVMCNEWNLTVTSANKDFVFDFKPFEDCMFLKSLVHYQSDLGMVVGIVGPGSYMQPFHAFEEGKSFEINEYYSDITDTVLRSAFFGGRDCFEDIKSRLYKYYQNVPLSEPMSLMRTYDEWLSLIKKGFNIETPLYENKYNLPVDRGYELLYSYCSKEEICTGESEDGPITTDDIDNELVPQTNTDPRVWRLPIETSTDPMKSFERRVFLRAFEWSSTFTSESMNPLSEMLSQDIISRSLTHLAYLSAGVELTFETTSPSSTGGILMVSVSQPFDAPTGNFGSLSTLCLMSQRDTMYIHAGQTNETSIVVPFTSIFPYINPKDPMLSNYVPSITIVPISKLTSSLGVPPKVTVKVYGKFVNMVSSGATGHQEVGFPVTGESEPEEKFSDKVSAVAGAVADASSIPGLGALKVPAQIVKAGAGIAHKMGFSNPMSVASSNVIPTTQTNMPNMRGSFAGDVLAPDQSQNLAPAGDLHGFPADEMGIQTIAGKWTIVDRFNLDTNQVYETELATYNVTPSIYLDSTEGGIQPAACAIAPLHFLYYAGSMEYRLDFAVPANAECRIKVLYDPIVDSHSANSQTKNVNEDYNEHAIIDVSLHKSATFTIGHTSALGALECLPSTNTTLPHSLLSGLAGNGLNSRDLTRLTTHWRDPAQGSTLHHNGRLCFKIQSPLTSASGLPFTSEVVVSARCCTKQPFNFYGYNGGLPTGLSNQAVGQVVPPMENSQAETPSTCLNGIFPNCMGGGTSVPPGTPAPTADGSGNAPPKETGAPSSVQAPSVLPVPTGPPVSAPTFVPTMATNAPTAATVAPTAATIAPSAATVTPTAATLAPTAGATFAPVIGRFQDFGREFVNSQTIGTNFSITGFYNNTTRRLFIRLRLPANTEGNLLLAGYSVAAHPVPEHKVVFAISDPTLFPDLTLTNGELVTRAGNGNEETWDLKLVGTTNGDVVPYRVMNNTNSLVTILREVILAPNVVNYIWTPPPSELGTVHTMQLGTLIPVLLQSSPWVVLDDLTPLSKGGLLATGVTLVFITIVFSGTLTVSGGPVPETHTTAPGVIESVLYGRGLDDDVTIMVTNGALIGATIPLNFPFIGGSRPAVLWPDITNATPLPAARRLKGILSTLRGEAEEEIDDGDDLVVSFGATGVNNEFVNKALSGESVSSYRALLKIPSPSQEMTSVSSGPLTQHEATAVTSLFFGLSEGRERSLLWYIRTCFAYMKGGLVNTYHIIGDGAIEASISRDGTITPQAQGGVSIIDSRVNPTASVKYPWQSAYEFGFARSFMVPDPLKNITIRGWNGDVRVREYESTAEDFNLMSFSGAGRVFITG